MANRTSLAISRSALNERKMKIPISFGFAHWVFPRGVSRAIYIAQDYLVRDVISDFIAKDQVLRSSVEKVEISKSANAAGVMNFLVTIHSLKPSRVCRFTGIDSNGDSEFSQDPDCAVLKDRIIKSLVKSLLVKRVNCDIRVVESVRIERSAALIGKQIVMFLENRDDRSSNQFIRSFLRQIGPSDPGVLIRIKGRIKGASIAREEVFRRGRLRLNSFNERVQQFVGYALTPSGVVGVSVWLNTGGFRVKV